jgi:hypothetical protein
MTANPSGPWRATVGRNQGSSDQWRAVGLMRYGGGRPPIGAASMG